MCGRKEFGGVYFTVDGPGTLWLVDVYCISFVKRAELFGVIRCRRVCCGKSAVSPDEFMRIGVVPEDADMGADECNPWIPVSSEHLDTTRCGLERDSNETYIYIPVKLTCYD